MPNDETAAGVPEPGRLFETASRLATLARLTDGLGVREPFLLVTGAPGTGKSTLVREVVARWGARVVASFVTAAAADRVDLLEGILRGFGTDPPAGAGGPQLLDRIERHVAEAEGGGRVPVIVVDDAHMLADESFAELWALTHASLLKHRPLEIVLVGLPSLEARLDQAALENLRQHVAVRCALQAFSQTEAVGFVREIAASEAPEGAGFLPRKTVREIFKRAGGAPGAIHELARQAMEVARASRARAVTVDHVARAGVRLAATSPSVPPSRRAGAGAPSPGVAAETVSSAATPQAASAPELGVVPEAPIAPAMPAAVARGATARAEADAPELVAAPEAIGQGDIAPPAPVAPGPDATPGAASDRVTPAAAAPDDEATRVATPASTPVVHDDPRVSEWVGRFIKPDAPRFGELLMAPPPTVYDLDSIAWESDAAGAESVETPAEARASRSLPHPRAPRTRRGRGGSSSRRGSATRWAPVGLGLAAATVVVLAWAVVPSWREAWTRGVARSGSAGGVASRPGGSPASAPSMPAPLDAKAASAPTSFAVRKSPAAPPAAPAAGGSVEAPAAAPKNEELFALDVGAYADPDEARAERDRIVIATGLKGWLVPTAIPGGETYRVVIGVYRSRERAEISAAALIERDLAFEAQVIPLPPRHRRR